MPSYDTRSAAALEPNEPARSTSRGPGKQTLVERIEAPVQRRPASDAAALQDSAWHGMIQLARGAESAGSAGVQAAAAKGVATASGPLPHAAQIQRSFGTHDISSIQAHTGSQAATSASAMGADAYATGDHVVLGPGTDLHTVAHEAAHVVQQRGGVQLKGGVGAAGDTYERHADAVADRVVAGESAQDLLDSGATGGATHAVQRQPSKDDAILEHQASLKGPDVEIPALEGALLTTRLEAVKQGLLSQASFDAGLKLSQAMTRLQPSAAKDSVEIDVLAQQIAAVAAHQLFAALRAETADEKHFKTQAPHSGTGGGISSVNPYTEEVRLSHYGMVQHTSSLLEQLPALILARKWPDAFASYRRLLDGLDRWVADQLRKKAKGTPEEALGDAQQHHAQLRTGLEQIADKHATRLPALFHPDAKTVEKEQAAGRPASDTVPMNVYFWKDEKDGKYHLYDLTTPSRPHEQTIDGQPTAAMLSTFFENVARYPEGQVRYTLPDGASGSAATTGKTKWYEWVGYAGLGAAAVGLAFLTAGASVPTTVCFAAGALASGVSSAGHIADTLQLGTATSASIVLDVAQLAGSFMSAGALNLTLKAGGAAAALAGSRWFVPLVGAAAGADVVQLVALSDITFIELSKVQSGAGTPEEKQRAMSVLLTQLTVMSGLTALSVQGARSARALAGQSLEIVEQHGAKVLRVAGEPAAPGVAHSDNSGVKSGENASATGQRPGAVHDARGEGVKSPERQGANVGDESTSAGGEKGSRAAKSPTKAETAAAPGAASMDRLHHILREAGIASATTGAWDSKALARIAAQANTLGELEKILPLVKRGKITGLENWIAYSAKKIGDDAIRTAGELREAARQSAVNPNARIDIGGDFHAPESSARPGERLPSFDMEVKEGGKTARSVEVGTAGSADAPVKSGADVNSGVGHAIDKVSARSASGKPIPGKHDATIRVTLAQEWDQKSRGIVKISANGDRIRLTRQQPPEQKAMSNIFDEFTAKITDNPMHHLLDRINLVDASSGALLAQYENVGGVWKRVH